jgi:hypothetical protein
MPVNRNYTIFKCGVKPTHFKCICILVATTLKMAALAVEACRWSIRNKITFLKPNIFVGLTNKYWSSN